jgi:ApaG protein
MEGMVTKGIKVKVTPEFQADLSNPRKQKFIFTYEVHITNESDQSVQLLSRKWTIFDSAGVKRNVEGKGVIGKQPHIAPGAHFSYESWCPLISEMGYMEGVYIMKSAIGDSTFEVAIPRFLLIADSMKN